jgi:hypothetical protein
MAHTCNSSYPGGRDEEDGGLKSDQGNSSQDPISRKNYHKKGLKGGGGGRGRNDPSLVCTYE